MNRVLLIDFGSTYTKVTAVDLKEERILGTASAYTTVQTDVSEGLSCDRTEKTGAKRSVRSGSTGGLPVPAQQAV